ncbi:MAG: hypothetical protein HYW95_02425 [Candidatus Wildermuthbacteria bacterium]|nr:hypothetical protein [Candidatus Wildermuthbacteria bacterium]
MVSEEVAPEIAALGVAAVGIVLLWEWWLNRLYGMRHSGRFRKPVVTGLYFIVNNLFVLLVVLLPALLVFAAVKPDRRSLFGPFLAAMALLNILDIVMDILHGFFNPKRGWPRSLLHLLIDGGVVMIYGMALLFPQLHSKSVLAALAVLGLVLADIIASIIGWFVIGPVILHKEPSVPSAQVPSGELPSPDLARTLAKIHKRLSDLESRND